MTRLRPVARDRLRGQALGIVFQHLHLIGAVSVLDNLRLARRMAGLAPDDTHLRGLLAALGLADKAARRPRGLSFGEAQRVAIARALANRPRLLLADEPTAALDDDNCARVAELLLAQAAAAGASLLVATHDRRLAGHFEERLELAGGGAP
jgi:putative ABC transport system ATP-binding protein